MEKRMDDLLFAAARVADGRVDYGALRQSIEKARQTQKTARLRAARMALRTAAALLALAGVGAYALRDGGRLSVRPQTAMTALPAASGETHRASAAASEAADAVPAAEYAEEMAREGAAEDVAENGVMESAAEAAAPAEAAPAAAPQEPEAGSGESAQSAGDGGALTDDAGAGVSSLSRSAGCWRLGADARRLDAALRAEEYLPEPGDPAYALEAGYAMLAPDGESALWRLEEERFLRLLPNEGALTEALDRMAE